MTHLLDQHRAYSKIRERLWPSRKQFILPAPPPALLPTPQDNERAAKLAELQKQVQAIAANVAQAQGTDEIRVRQTPVALIIETVCAYYGVRLRDVLSVRRTRAVVLPRQIAMYLCRELTVKSMPEIGRRFANKDHTTVLHAIRKIEALRKADKLLDQQITELTERLTVCDSVAAVPAFLPVRAP